ncbi:MAG: SDR family NAD(P)-dependent oxidoreductase [Pelagibacteraceae bacterium]
MNFLITGATSGLGKALFQRLSEKKDNNFYLISRNKEKLENIKKDYKNVKTYCLNLKDINETKILAKKISVESQNKIDVLICNAAEGGFGNMEDVPFKKYIEDININFFSHLILIKEIYLLMKLNNFGHIINISSGAAIVGIKGSSSYSTSKSAMQILMESMYYENLDKNIHPKNFFPGLINSDFDQKNKTYGHFEKPPIIKKKDINIVAKIIVKKLFKKNLNIFCQPSPFVAFIIKAFPFLEKLRRLIF